MGTQSLSPMIEFIDVCLPPVLEDFNFRVEKREFLFLVGKTGAGKTTTLKLACFDTLPNSGEVIVMGVSSERASLKNRLIVLKKTGLFLENPLFFEDISLVNNLLYVIDGGRDKALKSLNTVGLLDKSDVTPAKLSRGEKDLLQIAILCAKKPILALLDEPTSSLTDRKWEIMDLIIGLHRLGTTVFMTTKDEEVIERYPYRRIYLQ
jgi:cell division transport system ATP-binding protein